MSPRLCIEHVCVAGQAMKHGDTGSQEKSRLSRLVAISRRCKQTRRPPCGRDKLRSMLGIGFKMGTSAMQWTLRLRVLLFVQQAVIPAGSDKT